MNRSGVATEDKSLYKVYEYQIPVPSWSRAAGGDEEEEGAARVGGQEKEGGGKTMLVLQSQAPASFSHLPYAMPSTLKSPKCKRIWRDLQCLYLLTERVHHHYAAQLGHTRAPKLLQLCQKWLSGEPKNDKDLLWRSASPLATFNLLTDRGKASGGEKFYTACPTCNLVCPLTGVMTKHDVTKRPFLRPPFLPESVKLSCHDPDVLHSVTRCRLRPRGAAPKMAAAPPAPLSCPLLRAKQDANVVPLKIRNILSMFSPTFPNRDASRKGWLDSSAIDCALHVMARFFPEREHLYLISAENDPAVEQIIATSRCYKYLLLILFRKSHWTLLWMSHPCQEMWLFNSQIVSLNSVAEQLKPFKEAFPNYYVAVGKVPQQNNARDCGVFCLWYSYCLLFCPDSIHAIVVNETDQLRAYFVEQLLVSYVL